MENYIYSGKFSGNILIVGQTECGKMIFMQKLALNIFFRKLKKTEWVSGIELSKTREAKIETNFSCKVDFHYLSDEDKLSDQLDQFKLESKSNELDNFKNVKNIFGEKSVRDRLIVFDDVSGLADDSKKIC